MEFQRANYFDYTGLQIYAENDTHTYFNGTWKFVKDLKKPWRYHFYTEKYVQGKWLIQAADMHISDMCQELHNPTKPWYSVYKHVEKCPRPAGVNSLHYS